MSNFCFVTQFKSPFCKRMRSNGLQKKLFLIGFKSSFYRLFRSKIVAEINLNRQDDTNLVKNMIKQVDLNQKII